MQTKTLQAPDAGSGAADGDEGRKSRSKRAFLLIGADGVAKEVDTIEEANGARFTLLNPNGNADFDSPILGEPGQFPTMCAIFGYPTKIGNVANTVLNDKEDPGTPDDAANAIRDFMTKAMGGVWAERTTGGVGSRVDKPALAGAAVAVAEATNSKKWAAGIAAGKTADDLRGELYAECLAKLESDPAYVRQVRSVDAIAREYATRTGKPAKSVDDVL